MKIQTIETYSINELRTLFPDAYESAFYRFRDSILSDETPWQREIADSHKALLASKPSGDARQLSGARAMAWLENNVLAGLRKRYLPPAKRYAAEKRHGTKHPYALAGETPACPLTGVYCDEDFIQSLKEDLRDGCTLAESFRNLSDVAARLIDAEAENAISEESFELWAEGREFTANGRAF